MNRSSGNNASVSKKPVAVVAGAIKGIGLHIARSLADRGVRCVLTYYDWLDNIDDMHETMKTSGEEYVAVNADLTKRADVQRVVAEAEEMGGPDILINNVERGGWPVVHGAYTEEQWLLEFQTTVTAKWNLYSECIVPMKRKGNGVVVNISSISAVIGRSGPAGYLFNDCYSLSNRAVGSLTERWAREAAPEVRVNELMLGFFETRHGPGTRGWNVLDEERKQELLKHTLLGRTGCLDDITGALMFMVFDSPFMTGTTIKLDGGFLIGGEYPTCMPEGVVKPGESNFGGTIKVKE